jgi:hypothetical protein
MRARFAVLAVLVGLIVAAPSPALAGHHLWKFSQLFSNASGTVQFIQLVVNEDNEQGVGPFTITAGANTFTFGTNLPLSTTFTHKWILIATSNFAGLPGGVTPDYIIPANFFPTGGGTLGYASGVDTWTYGAVPINGVSALFKSGATVTTGTNAPANFNLQTGSVNLAAVVPALPGVAIALLVGALLVAGSGLLRRRLRAVTTA